MAEPTSPELQEPPSLSPPSQVPILSLTSNNTALALLPPKPLWPRLDRLRALYDKAYPKWPPHINLVYPFVRPELLDEAVDRVGAALLSSSSSSSKDSGEGGGKGVGVRLDGVGVFEHKRDNTVYLCDEDPGRREEVERLRGAVLASLGGGETQGKRGYQMHLTVAQSEDVGCAAHKFLVEKVGLVPRVEWDVTELAVLVRERDGQGGSVMRLWGRIALEDGRVERLGRLAAFYQGVSGALKEDEGDEEEEGAERDLLQSRVPYCSGKEEPERWTPFMPPKLVVASYNVLAEFEWPASEARYPLVVKNILAENAAADVLVLQEVTDGFLSYLLSDQRIRDAYPFCSHGPPHEDDIEPLPSYLNVVVLSATPFDWEYVSFHRKHKGAVVARLKHAGRSDGDKFLPVVLAAVHLSHGLNDGAVAAKKTDIKRIIGYLSDTYPEHPWILAGDFNVTTSSLSVDAARKNKAISDLSASHLANLDNLFAEAKLVDAWKSSVEDDSDGDDAEGEQGATWDPTANGMAAAMSASGGNVRPQRYDRILVRGEGFLEISEFNMFGFLTEQGGGTMSEMFASDHWGIRCTLNMGDLGGQADEPSEQIASLVVPVHPEKAPEHLAQPGSLKTSLLELEVIPSEDEAAKRKRALDLLKTVILDTPAADAAGTRAQPAVVVVPVGSYALDVWTSSSDIDVLCIGPFSSNTFFALASQRLRKAAAQGIRILRRVRANTGTMLEIEVHDIKMDLQYCPATSVAERWPDVLRTPAADPVWSLSAQTLSKLKAIRDIDYLRRSLPDLSTFRLAHRFLKTWAKSRGIYAARFGFLSGIQIAILLARVHKLLTHKLGTLPSPETLITTFFTHYATFDWSTQLAFDPLFHRRRLPYTRTAREPLAILGYFPPALNTALAASVPSTKTLASEFRRASASLCVAPSWTAFLSSSTATADFLAAHKSYVKLDVQYWGLSLARGAQFLGWLESRCVMLLVDLHRRAPGLYVRMWPARFVERAGDDLEEEHGGEGGDEDDKDFRGCYLIGLDKGHPDMAKEDLKVALGALQTVLARFEGQMRGDEKYFDARSCWLSAAVVNRAELGELELDSREWGEYTPGDEEFDEEEEEEEEEMMSGQDSEQDELARKDKKKKGAAARKQIATVDLRADKTKKFRTAADAINRIRWDPQLDSSDYLVGYEDRFTGPQEEELDAWKGEQTDEEFIPQHRILYFKRKSDGRVVWDRRTRWDELFGNGA
ncbi:2'-5' RNA ligase superfamily-domain-containing protein [Parachaetomium inaequale]|uniref:polynucleotide adenylyltransferase n=1 Tax=Parachaetomium inaequale TaxID=2588326 RepID=A0AAN6PLP9_9PEZI|nr:2'-5' RNA ligase superfamily-domain-containing protein [Parachaetomium inaequale]